MEKINIQAILEKHQITVSELAEKMKVPMRTVHTLWKDPNKLSDAAKEKYIKQLKELGLFESLPSGPSQV